MTISGRPAGLFYGAQTLLQLAAARSGRTFALPAADSNMDRGTRIVKEWPAPVRWNENASAPLRRMASPSRRFCSRPPDATTTEPTLLIASRMSSLPSARYCPLREIFTGEDEAWIDSLVPPGEHSGKGFQDPMYPVTGRMR